MPRGPRFNVKDLTFKEKALFSKSTIAVSGSFHNNPQTHWNDTNLTRWITLHGGRYHKGPATTREVTHFVTDEHELQSRSPKAAEALRNKHIEIVPLEWLEFSMINRTVLPIVAGGEYDFRDKLRKEAEKEKRLKKEAAGMVMGEWTVNTNLYRVYTDRTFFRYEIELLRGGSHVHVVGQGLSPPPTPMKQQQQQLDEPRVDAAPGGQQLPSYEKNETGNDSGVEAETKPEPPETPTKAARAERGEKYTLTLYESIAKPSLYFFCAKYSKSSTDTLPKYYRPSETPQLFWTEYTHFVKFFHKKTSVEWRKRLLFYGPDKVVPGKRKGKEREVDDGEGSEGLERGWFRYVPPTGGKPVGWVPEGYVPKDEGAGEVKMEE